MLEYLLNNYFLLLYFLALVLSIIKYRYYYDSVLKYLPILLAYTLMNELLGLLVRDVDEIQIIYNETYYNYNAIIFNIFDIIFFLYFFYIYRNTIRNRQIQNITLYGAVVLAISCIVNLYLQSFYVEPQSYAIIVGAVILLTNAIAFLIELNQSNQKSLVKRNLLFWISMGIVFFYSIYPITMYLISFHFDLYTTYNFTLIHNTSIGIFYAFIIIGLVLMKKYKTITS